MPDGPKITDRASRNQGNPALLCTYGSCPPAYSYMWCCVGTVIVVLRSICNLKKCDFESHVGLIF